MGKMGSGKTLTQSILANYIHNLTGLPLYANYTLKNAEPIQTALDIWTLKSAIFCFDEIWITMDSRNWKNNIDMTQWVNQTRKKKLLIFYTTQHINQVEMRVRKATDVLIYTERTGNDIWLNFIDYQYQRLGRRYLIEKPQRFYDLYNTFEIAKPITKTKPKQFDNRES